jgi:glycerate dehydrogenase
MATSITTLLVYGELTIGPKQRRRLAARGIAVREVPRHADPDIVRQELSRSEAVVFNNVDINPFLVNFKPNQIGILAATGSSFIDVAQARRLGVRLARLSSYSIPAVVEFMLAAAFSAARSLGAATEAVSSGNWDKSGLFGIELAGRTAGIIGYGQIGTRLAGLLKALGMNVVVTSRKDRSAPGVDWRPLNAVIREADFLFVCCDANAASKRLLNKTRLMQMRSNAVLISISPNSVIDLVDLADILRVRGDLRAILDLDPLPREHPLLSVPSARITPHIGFATFETLERRLDDSIDTLFAALDGGRVAWLSPEFVQDSRMPTQPVTGDMLWRRDHLLELASGFYYAQSLYALIQLGVMSLLEDGPAGVQALAERLAMSEDNLALLLDAATALEVLERHADRTYTIAAPYAPLLAPSSPYYVGPMIASAVECAYEPWGQLTSFLRSGIPSKINQSLRENSSEWARRLTLGSNAASTLIAEQMLQWLIDQPVDRILDIGCGPAVLTRKLLQYFPNATATLIDRALPLAVCRNDFLQPEGITGRCDLIDLDFTDLLPLPGGHDITILTNVIHMVSPGIAPDLLARSVAALVPGGRLVLTSFLCDDAEHPFPAHFSISCRLLSGHARGYSITEILGWLSSLEMNVIRCQKIGIFTAVIMAERRGS